jgi:hypothetical protein
MLMPLANSKLKTLYPWRIPRSKPFTPEEFQTLKTFNLKILHPWRIQAQNPLPLKNSRDPRQGVLILNGIAHLFVLYILIMDQIFFLFKPFTSIML